jgi:hypothetical protein
MKRTAFEDDRLRLIFTCCHPSLPPEAHVALTLREVSGLTTEQIAKAFLVTPRTLAAAGLAAIMLFSWLGQGDAGTAVRAMNDFVRSTFAQT